MQPSKEQIEAAKRIARAILNRSTEGAATRVALKQATAGGVERDLGGLNAIALTEVISEQLASLIAEVRRQTMEEAAVICDDYDNGDYAADQWACAELLRARMEEGK